MLKTNYCTNLNKQFAGKKVKLAGWVSSRRDHGKIIFIDLRDRTGIVQLVISPENKVLYEIADKLRGEFVIAVEGTVNLRPTGMQNKKIATGEVEVVVEALSILAKSKTLPFEINKDTKTIDEEKRMEFRYLDLRSERMKKNLLIRHKAVKFIRDYMDEKGFLEVETPILSKSTPEGARDFVVPSRLHPGKFYALPQSPQQYKQLLMAGGLEKYFQIARCLRDEDPRADRQAEHTQLDLEMSFIENKEEIMAILEELIIKLVEYLEPLTGKKLLQKPLPRLTWAEAMAKYQTDKPDLRKNQEPNTLAFAWVVEWPQFEWNKDEKRWDPMHHMFVLPEKGYEKYLDSNPEKVISTQFDLVCNGYEICSGSLRINTRQLQEKIFKLIRLGVKKGQEQFGHLLESFDRGCPPHGGVAPGIDRLVMLLAGEDNIREVIAFPKTGDGRDLMMAAPSEVSPEQLRELKIEVVKKRIPKKKPSKN